MKRFLFCLCFVLLGTLVFAQMAARVEEITGTETLNLGQACYIAGLAGEKFEAGYSYEQAFQYFANLKELQKSFKNKTASTPLRIDMLANLAFFTTGADGGLWYRVSKSPHYAFRALKKTGLVPLNTPPSKLVSGRQALELFYELATKATAKEKNNKKNNEAEGE